MGSDDDSINKLDINRTTTFNKSCPGVSPGQSNSSPRSNQEMDDTWGQDEHPQMKSLARKMKVVVLYLMMTKQKLLLPGGVKNKGSPAVKDANITPQGWKNQPEKNGNDILCMMRDKMTTCRKR